MTQNILPTLLYKYRAMGKFTKRILSHGEIYFATLPELNDPFEYHFVFTEGAFHSLSAMQKKLFQLQAEGDKCWLTPEQNTQKYIVAMKNDTNGVFCLSESRDNIHMYAHYANSFQGICIGFDSTVFKHHPSLRKMIYTEEPYKVDSGHASVNDWVEILSRKSTVFVQEQEWRIVDKKGVLCNSCDLLVVSEEPDFSTLPPKFTFGFIYNNQSKTNYTNFWYVNKQNNNPIPLSDPYDWQNEYPDEVAEFDKMIRQKPKAPNVARLTHSEIQLINKVPLTNSSQQFPNQPMTLNPQEIKSSIKEIIFGFNISEKDVNFIIHKLKKVQPKYYVAKPVIGDYKVEIHPFNNYEDDIARYREIYGYK